MPIRDLPELLASLSPVLHSGTCVYVQLPPGADPAPFSPLAFFREAEGLTLILAEAEALAHGLRPLFRCAWITLEVHSDLAAVGLSAAVAKALAEAGISCNVVAAACHDHLFVPAGEGARALAALRALQKGIL